jgi:signal transduction histidine kinase
MPANVTLKSELTPQLKVDADRDQLTQVLVNLLGNAREALAEGGGGIHVRTLAKGSEALLEVADTGPGISSESRQRLFEPYFTTKAGGTGLGLAIASRIAEEHGGRLELDGAPPPGACFRLRLPVA